MNITQMLTVFFGGLIAIAMADVLLRPGSQIRDVLGAIGDATSGAIRAAKG